MFQREVRNTSLLTLGTGTRAEVLVFLPIPKKRVSGQMFGNYGILCMRFKLPLGNTGETFWYAGS